LLTHHSPMIHIRLDLIVAGFLNQFFLTFKRNWVTFWIWSSNFTPDN
jgi:hypothetical protein